MLFSFSKSLPIIAFSVSRSKAQVEPCADVEHATANATGSIQIPGFQPFIAIPLVQNSTWTISTGIHSYPDSTTDSYNIEQHFWLETDPPINTSPGDLPYTGCTILLTYFKSPR